MYNSVYTVYTVYTIQSILTMLCKHTTNSRTFLSPQKKPISITVIPIHASLHFCFFKYFIIGGKLLYNVELIFAVQQWESALIIHTPPPQWPGEFHGLYSPWGHKESDTTERLSLSLSPPSWASFPSTHPRLGSLCCIVTSHQLSFLYMIVYIMLMLHSPFVPLSPSPKSHSSKGHMYPIVHCNMIYNSQDMEATLISIYRWRDKVVVHKYNGILLSHTKKRILVSSIVVNKHSLLYRVKKVRKRKTSIIY